MENKLITVLLMNITVDLFLTFTSLVSKTSMKIIARASLNCQRLRVNLLGQIDRQSFWTGFQGVSLKARNLGNGLFVRGILPVPGLFIKKKFSLVEKLLLNHTCLWKSVALRLIMFVLQLTLHTTLSDNYYTNNKTI